MTTQVATQPAQNGCEVGVPRQRQRRRGTPKAAEKDPVALATGNGHSRKTASAVAAVAAAEENRPVAKKAWRRFHRVPLGPAVEVIEGRVERWRDEVLVFVDEDGRQKGWVPNEEAIQYEVVLDRYTHRPSRRRVRVLDEDGFPTQPIVTEDGILGGWEETDRWLSEPTVIKFEEGAPLPRLIRTARPGEQRCHPDKCVGGYRLIYRKRRRKSRPPIDWFPASDTDRRRALLASLPKKASAKIRKALAAEPKPKPVEIPDQWFRVELPQVSMQGTWGTRGQDDHYGNPPDARENFPDGWCAKLVRPRPIQKFWEDDKIRYRYNIVPEWMYVQLPYHYDVWYEDQRGRLSSRRLTDFSGDGLVECGMWIPRWLLAPISSVQAAEIYDLLAEQVAADDAR